jgi:hypothetical protein
VLREQRIENLAAVRRKRAVQPAERLVISERERDSSIAPCHGKRPQPVQHMLHQRELIGSPDEPLQLIVRAILLPRCERGEVVQEAVDERRFEGEAADRRRADDRLTHFIAAHAGRQVEPFVDCFREPFDQRRRAEIFGAHRDGDVDARFAKRRTGAL